MILHNTKVTCLYCGLTTGTSTEPGRKTVCHNCAWSPNRSELREVLAGQRPWARPLEFLIKFLVNGEGSISDEEAAKAQSAWDRWQNWVRAFNAAHLGCSCSPEEQSNGHQRMDGLPRCDAPDRYRKLAALPIEDRTAYEDYRKELAERS